MTDTISAKLREAALQLAQSERGREALKGFHDWITDHGSSLDGPNKDAILTLLAGAWSGRPGSTREIIQEVLSVHE